MFEHLPYPVGHDVWLFTKEIHIAWDHYDLTLCGRQITERETQIQKAAEKIDKKHCEQCVSNLHLVQEQYNERKRNAESSGIR